ncbi:MAG: ABC transporter ATP-binding protein [Nitrospinota bacterium]
MAKDVHIVVDHISKVFGDGADAIQAIRDIFFEVQRGEFVSILGPSGCGKSTLLSLVAGLIPPSAGRIEIDGARVTAPRRETALVFQTPVLFPWRTVIRNVLFPIEILHLEQERHHQKALKLLEMTGLVEFKDRLPEQLSGGMTQRAAICRALISDPKLLLMDEPFSALDTLTREDMNIELLRIWDQFKKTVLFVTHSIRESVFLSDRVILMSPRPARLVREFRIDLPRPRTVEMQEHEEFNRYCAAIRQAMGR